MATTDADIKKALGKYAKFEGDTVRAVALELPSLAGGLREATKVEPYVMHRGDRGYLLIEVDCSKVRHEDFIDKNAGEKASDREPGGDCTRVQILIPGVVAFADADLVKPIVDQMRDRQRAQNDHDAGEPQIEGLADGSDPEPEADDDEQDA